MRLNLAKIVLNSCEGNYRLSEKAYRFLGIPWDGEGLAFSDDRHNEELIECVEILGPLASGPGAQLEVSEVVCPCYAVAEWKGREWIELF